MLPDRFRVVERFLDLEPWDGWEQRKGTVAAVAWAGVGTLVYVAGRGSTVAAALLIGYILMGLALRLTALFTVESYTKKKISKEGSPGPKLPHELSLALNIAGAAAIFFWVGSLALAGIVLVSEGTRIELSRKVNETKRRLRWRRSKKKKYFR